MTDRSDSPATHEEKGAGATDAEKKDPDDDGHGEEGIILLMASCGSSFIGPQNVVIPKIIVGAPKTFCSYFAGDLNYLQIQFHRFYTQMAYLLYGCLHAPLDVLNL